MNGMNRPPIFNMAGPTQQQGGYRYRGVRRGPAPTPQPYAPPVRPSAPAAAPAAPGGTSGGIDPMLAQQMDVNQRAGFGRNSDLDGNYDAMMARISSGKAGAGYWRGQPSGENVGAPVGLYEEGGAVEDEGVDDALEAALEAALGKVKQVEQYRREKHGLLAGAPESENIEDRREGDMLRPPMQLGQASNLDSALGAGNTARTLASTSPMRGELDDTGVRAKQPLGFAEGGAVEEEDYSEDPFARLAQEAPAEGGFRGAGGSGSYDAPDPARVMQYLQGADAVPTQVAQEYEAKVDPEGAQDEGTRKVMAVAAAADEDPALAAGLSAGYRQKYDAYRGIAAGALEHGDLDKAAQAASKAYPNVLDGTDVKFTRQGDGVTATVKPPRGQPVNVPLSKNQFNEFLKGNAGQYDHVMELGAAKLLQDLARSGGAVPTNPNTGAGQDPGPEATQWVDKEGIQRGGNPEDHPEGARTGERVAPREAGAQPDSLEARAMRIFPKVSQGQLKEKWINDQRGIAEQRDIERLKITEGGDAKRAVAESGRQAREHAAETGVLREQTRQAGQLATAAEKAGAYERVNAARNGVRTEGDRLKALTAIRKIEADSQNAQEKNAASLLGKEILNVGLGKPLSKAAQKAVTDLESFHRTPSATPSLGGAPGAPPAAPSAPSGGSTRVQNKTTGEWYVQRPDGLFYKEKK